MKESVQTKTAAAAPGKTLSVKILAVGGAGLSVMEQLEKSAFPEAALVAINTDTESLAGSSAAEKISLETKLLRGLGAGGDPERGRAAAEENFSRLKTACEGTDAILIIAGLGGAAGTGISPVLARAAKEAGALALAFVTLPFDCEGNRRQRQAQHGLQQLKAAADGVICLPNQKVFKLIDENTSVIETFKITNRFLADGVNGVWRLMASKGLIEIHFAELCALLRDRHGESLFATAEAQGPARSRGVLDKLLSHPMFDGGQMLSESDAVLVSLLGGPDLTMAEVNRVMEQVNRHCERAQVIMGAAVDESFRDRLAVTIISSRRNSERDGKPGEAAAARNESAASAGEEFNAQLLNPAETIRPHSRFVPPVPVLSPEKVEQLMARGTTRQRKNAAKMRQGQLPLEIISKGRFDKSEPTIHKGEDLDVPTYIRRGVALN